MLTHKHAHRDRHPYIHRNIHRHTRMRTNTETDTHAYTQTQNMGMQTKGAGNHQAALCHSQQYLPPPFTGHHEPPRNQFLSLNPRFWSWRSQVGHASGISKVLLADVTHPGLRATPWALAQPTLPVSDGLGRSCPHLSRPGLPEAPEGAP